MIRCSNSVTNVLNRLFLEGTCFGNKRSLEQYGICIRNLRNLSHKSNHEIANSPRAWADSGSASLYVCRAGDYTFGYSLFADGIYVEEVMYQGKLLYETELGKDEELSDLSEFHSWMHRLDEVKGARPADSSIKCNSSKSGCKKHS